ncbi:hypothetical protein ACWNYG_00855 [Candidatus Karelsulcia muelleri]
MISGVELEGSRNYILIIKILFFNYYLYKNIKYIEIILRII